MSAETPNRNRQIANITGALAILALFFGGGVASSIEVQLAVIGAGLIFALAAAHFFSKSRSAA